MLGNFPAQFLKNTHCFYDNLFVLSAQEVIELGFLFSKYHLYHTILFVEYFFLTIYECQDLLHLTVDSVQIFAAHEQFDDVLG